MNLQTRFLDLLVLTLGKVPVTLRSRLGAFLGYLFYCIPTKDRKIVRLQFKAFYKPNKLSALDNLLHTPRVYSSVSQTLLESINLAPILKNMEQYVQSDDRDYIQSLGHCNKTVVALSAHTGNWDLLGAYMIHNGLKLATIARLTRRKALHHLLIKIRESYGIETFWRSDKANSRDLVDVFTKNIAIAGLIDQDTRVSSVYSDFFGAPARSPSGLIALAKRHDCIIVTAFNFRTAFCRYKVFVEEIDPKLSIEDTIHEYNRRLENYIRIYPEQWVWFHKRWRSKENAEKRMASKAYIEYLNAHIEAKT